MKMKRSIIPFVITPFWLGACGTGAPPTAEQTDLVVTSHEPTYSFKSATTYALPDKVVVITDPGTTAQEIDPTFSQHVLQSIRDQMNSRGYTEVPRGGSTPPNLFLEVSKMSTVNTEVYYQNWYSYYGAYYAPYYGATYGVGWSPVAVPYVVSATFGTLLINTTDPNHPNTTAKQIPSVWAAVLNGVIDNSTQSQIQLRVDNGIQQAFIQSPYFSRSTP